MTAVFSLPPTAAPAENWDNDFEFHQNAHSTTNEAQPRPGPGPSMTARISTASSYVSEDWDQEHSPLRDQRSRTTFIRDDQKDLFSPQWPDSGPSTPPRRYFPNSTENWDDDFEDKADSPARNASSQKRTPKAGTRRPSRAQEAENWDDDFLVNTDSPGIPRRQVGIDEQAAYQSQDDEDEDDDMELGFADREEDRTVTARSRRAALSRLTSTQQQQGTPPPPVPPIPLSLLTSSTHFPAEQPFPRSPTASVFSVPTLNSGRDSYYQNSSTTHLRPTISRTSIGGFANLPPSPRVHKERERRRLRKKSRPPEAVYELAVRNPISPAPNSSSDILDGVDDAIIRRSISPRTPPATPPLSGPHEDLNSTPSSSNHRNSISSSAGVPSPPNKTPLLSRIGSVKRWGVRRKRASATPSEILNQDVEANSGTRLDPDFNPEAGQSKSWFFRVSSNGITGGPSSGRMADSGDQQFPSIPPSPSKKGGADTSAKLVKRKSFGFIPIRRNLGPQNQTRDDGGSSSDLPEDLRKELRNESTSDLNSNSASRQHAPQSQASYGGLGLGRAGNSRRVAGSTDDLTEPDNGRRRSASRSREKQSDEREGSRGFLGNVRRISLVGGRHKRTKSGVSLASIGDAPRQVTTPEVPEHPIIRMASRTHPAPPALERSQSGASVPTARSDNLLAHSSTTTEKVVPQASLMPKPPTTPHSVSLGRSAAVPVSINVSAANGLVPRRNSLGDLKIPARISQAQVGLRRDLGMVREFAANVEQLKDLQQSYHSIVLEVQSILDHYAQVVQSTSRSTSPNHLNNKTPKARSRSNTTSSNTHAPLPQQSYKELASNFYTINSKYRIAWECAELLIELGGGSTAVPTSAPSTSMSAPAITQVAGRDRAITLTGEEAKSSRPPSANSQVSQPSHNSPPLASPPTTSWRASTGRHDLNQRQLQLLKEMLNNPDSSFVIEDGQLPIPEEALQSSTSVNRHWRWGDAMNSTVTLPSEESSARAPSPSKKRRTSRLGMTGLRDMLRALKKSSAVPLVPVSSTSVNTQSSESPTGQPGPAPGRRRAKTSSGPESMRSVRPTSPYGLQSSTSNRASPRRPSLASIFRLGQKSKVTPPSSMDGSSIGQSSAVSVTSPLQLTLSHQSEQGSSAGEDEDWDHLEIAGDIDHPITSATSPRDIPTIRGRSPYQQHASLPTNPITPKRIASGSQTSLSGSFPTRPTRLSNVEENMDDHRTPQPSSNSNRPSRLAPSPSRQVSQMSKTGSVRSMPPVRADPQLAMTPDNIKPLLENAREVHARLTECIAAIRALLGEHQTK